MSKRTKTQATASSSDNSRSNPRLELAKALNTLSDRQDAFTKAISALEQFKKDELVRFDLELDAKQEELKQLEEEFQHKLKNKQIETDQQIAEYKYTAALNILRERNETTIVTTELEKMKEELNHLRSDLSKRITEAVEAERADSKRAISSAISNASLNHKAETAVLTATVDQQKKEIATLQATINNLKEEVAAQRALTKEVAMASKAAPITQQIGKSS